MGAFLADLIGWPMGEMAAAGAVIGAIWTVGYFRGRRAGRKIAQEQQTVGDLVDKLKDKTGAAYVFILARHEGDVIEKVTEVEQHTSG